MKNFTLSFFLCLFIGNIYAQTIRYVDNNVGAPNNPPFNYNSIQAAIDASASGDILYVQPSPNHYGTAHMKKPLTIYGAGHNLELTSVNARITSLNFDQGNSSGSKISGLQLDGIMLFNTTFINNDIVFSNNLIGRINGNSVNNRSNNILFIGNIFYTTGSGQLGVYKSQNWIFTNNLINHDGTSSNLSIFSDTNSTTIVSNNIIKIANPPDVNGNVRMFQNCEETDFKNNIFIFTGSGVKNFTSLGGNSGLTFRNNLTYSTDSNLDSLAGTENINDINPLFISFNPALHLKNKTNDFHLQSGSPAIGVATDGGDIGVFNGEFPFNMSGYPNELPYMIDFSISQTVLSSGSTLKIQLKANPNLN